jgi:hypothetical protein
VAAGMKRDVSLLFARNQKVIAADSIILSLIKPLDHLIPTEIPIVLLGTKIDFQRSDKFTVCNKISRRLPRILIWLKINSCNFNC